MSTIKQRMMNGMFWTVSERISLQAVQLIVSIIIARVLEPSEFGLIGMLAIFTSVAQAILDSGFGAALIQKKDTDETDTSSIFFFNLVIGVILAILLVIGAPLIARFYNQPILINVLRVLSLGLIINAFSLVQTTILTKNLEFKTQMKVNLIAALGSGLIGIFMGVRGFGVWALATQILSRKLFAAILLWLINSWRPSLRISFESLKSMFAFGSNLLFSSIIGTIFNNLYQTLIGRIFTATDLGFYTKATTIETSINHITGTSLGKVMFPAMVPLQDDQVKLKQAYRKTMRLSLFLHLPLMIGLSLSAEPLILFLLTEKWAGSIPILQLLALVGIFYPLTTLNLNIIIVKGHSKTYMQLENIKRGLTILAILLTFRWGILALIYGQLVVEFFAFLLYSHHSGKLIDYGHIEQLKDYVPIILKAFFMGVLVFLVDLVNISSHPIDLMVRLMVGIATYLITNAIFTSSDFKEVLMIGKIFGENILMKIKSIRDKI